ncbi:MAG TPA: hypothetical protein IGS53_29005 [Leptolyngbyaceae cyanobacterium M33_DOE_097]|uniref:Type II CBASS E2 protein domain-containing protein n=1 Tax=Oscillatoriales cyanobacterium SpSt-418 TaxID=2282169 RepID=A0A7C3KID2_9CYAN|nr:hypothetical protein [Leptolyngbyaceae cyanobacterium M33_DOE_097]
MGLSKFEYSQLRPTANLAIQNLHILYRFPGFTYRRERGAGVWRGTLQPRPLSQKYRVAVSYKLCSCPTVKVIAPILLPKTPHLWGDGTLCLFYPKESPWKRDMLIATTILPWTALWLYYYELWLDTGKWLGPSSHSADRHLQGGYANPAEDNEEIS